MLNILIFQNNLVPLHMRIYVLSLAMTVCLLHQTDGYAQDITESAFFTIGIGGKKPKEIREKTSDGENVTDDIEGTQTSNDSIKPYMPMIAYPLKNITVNSPYGIRRDPIRKGRKQRHSGVDLKAFYENVYSMLPGVVTAASYSRNGGYFITVNHGSFACSYLHLSKILVKEGQQVGSGQAIAISGNTGKRTTGPHLHISCKWINGNVRYFNPMMLLKLVNEQNRLK